MLVSIVAELEALDAASLPATHGDLQQSEFFRQIAAIDPSGAALVHGRDNGQPRAYTLSPIFIDRAHLAAGAFHLRPGDRAWFRITGLNYVASTLSLALAGSARAWKIVSSDATAHFAIRNWCTLPGSHRWTCRTTVEDLLQTSQCSAEARRPETILLEFATPASFGSGNPWGNWTTFPIPEKVFDSIRKSASACLTLPDPIPGRESLLKGNVAVGAYRLESHMLSFQRHKRYRAGFTGSCEFLVNPEAPRTARMWIGFLMGLAFYTGVGGGTSWGMGMSRRVSAAALASRELGATAGVRRE